MDTSNPAIIVVDARNRLIRIHKNTLHLLDDPDYIQLLVNPVEKIVALRPGNPNNAKSERVNWPRLNNNHSCEMYSKPLIQQLFLLLPKANDISSIKLVGTHYKKENLIAFNMSDAEMIIESDGDYERRMSQINNR